MADSERRGLWMTARFVGFFALFYLYVWLRIDPSLHYESTPWFPAFSCGFPFLRTFLWCPGGVVEYAAAAVSQLYYYPWAGALVITAIAWLLCVATGKYLAAIGAREAAWLRYVPALGLLILESRYGYQLASVLALLVAVACAAVYVRVASWRARYRPAVFVGLCAVLYYLVAGPCVIYVVLCAAFEMRGEGRRLLALSYLLAGEAIPYVVGMLILDVSVDGAYVRFLPADWTMDATGRPLLLGLYLFFPVLAVVLARWPSAMEKLSRRVKVLPMRPAMRRLFAVVLVTGGVILSYDTVGGRELRVEHFAREKMWPEVLREARRLPPKKHGFGVTHNVNRALYHSGRLPHEMFSYPQAAESFLFGTAMGPGVSSVVYRARRRLFFKIGDCDLQLGLVNEAEHEAHEALATHGNHAVTLKRLALINAIKGQTGAARVFLNALSGDPIQGKWARRDLELLDGGGPRALGEDVERIRSVMALDEYDSMAPTMEARCLTLLERNKTNRMAFEYLMAYYLVTRQLDGFAANIHRLADFDYLCIPVPYEEALLLHNARTGEEVDLGGHWISAETVRRANYFMDTVAPLQKSGDIAGARRAVVDAYGNSYFFFYVFDESGVGKT